MIQIDRIDHLVLTVASIEATCAWYARVLGMEVREFGARKALHFGRQKINLHAVGAEIEPKAPNAGPGTGDICLITTTPLQEVLAHLRACDVAVLQGPVQRTGALGTIESVYLRDLDGNLIEIARYDEEPAASSW